MTKQLKLFKMNTIKDIIEGIKQNGIDNPENTQQCLSYYEEELGGSENDKIIGLVEDNKGFGDTPESDKFWENQMTCCVELYKNQCAYIQDKNKSRKYFIIDSKEDLATVKKYSAKILN
jgi:hypothetical protein